MSSSHSYAVLSLFPLFFPCPSKGFPRNISRQHPKKHHLSSSARIPAPIPLLTACNLCIRDPLLRIFSPYVSHSDGFNQLSPNGKIHYLMASLQVPRGPPKFGHLAKQKCIKCTPTWGSTLCLY